MKRMCLIVISILFICCVCTACTTKDEQEKEPTAPTVIAPVISSEPEAASQNTSGGAESGTSAQTNTLTPAISGELTETAAPEIFSTEEEPFSGLEIEDDHTEVITGDIGFGGN